MILCRCVLCKCAKSSILEVVYMAKNFIWYVSRFPWRKLRVNRKYKDRLFRYLFQNKKDLLQLYNAINGSDYKDPDALEIVTLEDAIFMKMKNDLSFIVANTLNLYEHQSTDCPNMPLRGLFYFCRQYEGLIAQRKYNIYGSQLIRIPTPAYVIFYNGTKEQEDRVELYLSDAFEAGRGSGCLECKALMVNINRGHNQGLLGKCRRLWEYSEFVSEVNGNLAKGYSLKRAVTMAMDDCIGRGVLADILEKNRAEVVHMILTEYDEKRHMKSFYEDGYEEGQQVGRDRLLEEQIRKKLKKGKRAEVIAEELEEDILTIQTIMEKMNS